MPRTVVLRITWCLLGFQWFRVLCIFCLGRGWFHRPIGLYTHFWSLMRQAFAADHPELAIKYGELERRYERLARVAGL